MEKQNPTIMLEVFFFGMLETLSKLIKTNSVSSEISTILLPTYVIAPMLSAWKISMFVLVLIK